MSELINKEYLDAQFEKLGLAIAKGFEETANKTELARLENKVDIIQGKLDNMLYKEFNRIETRVTRIEKHLGIKTV